MRVRVLQAREQGDPVQAEEIAAFAARLDLPAAQVLAHDLLHDPPDADRVLDGVDAVLVGGSGAFSVYDPHPWVHTYLDLLGELTTRDTPLFASCFGFQGLVVALGGRVEKDEANAEVGTFDLTLSDAGRTDPLFADLPARFAVQLGHKDRATVYPSGLLHLGSSERCPWQALRVAGKAIWGTQFHPELTQHDNLTRFLRYRDAYLRAFGEARFQQIADGFLPSPTNDGLLRRWRDLITA